MSNKFNFGKNWKRFVEKYFNEDKINFAQKSLCDFLKIKDLTGKTFVDVGCGSGLFSLAALRMGAIKVVSFDADPISVDCSKALREKYGFSDRWEIIEGSVFDISLLEKLGKFDIVYSWGVLHHTGNMWNVISNVLSMVNDDGFVYIAIYNKAEAWGIYKDGRFGTSKFWEIEKKIYSQMPEFLQFCVELITEFILIILYVLTFNNPVKKIKSHGILYRGMSWRTDIKDWLGGYPYEYAYISEVFKFVSEKGFCLVNLKDNNGLMNNEYLFKKKICE